MFSSSSLWPSFNPSSLWPTTNPSQNITQPTQTLSVDQAIYYTQHCVLPTNTTQEQQVIIPPFPPFPSSSQATLPPIVEQNIEEELVEENIEEELVEENSEEVDEENSEVSTDKNVRKKSKKFTNPFRMVVTDGEISVANEIQISNQKGKFIGSIDGDITPLKCFGLIFDKIKHDLLTKTNIRRNERQNQRKTKEGTRGRPINSSTTPLKQAISQDNQERYVDRFIKDFSEEDMNAFLSCFLMMGVAKMPSTQDYWRNLSLSSIGLGFYFNNRIKKYKFDEFYRCLDSDVATLEDSLNQSFKELWEMGHNVSSDESVVRATMRNNPHHMYQPCKPEKNGCKVYTSADASTFIGYLRLHRRTADEPKDENLFRTKHPKFVRGKPLPAYSMAEAITDGIDHIGNNHHYTVDKLYGSVTLIEEAASRGAGLTASCMKNRKSDVFTNFTHKQTPNEHGVVAASGLTEGGLKFSAFTAESAKGKKINFLTTSNISNRYAVLKDNYNLNEDDDGVSLAGKTLPIEVVKYFKTMGYVDQANKSIVSTQYPHRIYRWRIAYLFWLLSVIVHNSFVIYNSQVEKSKQLSKKNFVSILSQSICDPSIDIGKHELTGGHQGQKCVVCLRQGKSSNATTWCSQCGPMHKNCYAEKHAEFLLFKLTEHNKKKRKK